MKEENRATITINTIVLHTKFHLDEAEALRRLKSYGGQHFQEITSAKVKFTKGLAPQSDAVFDAQCFLPVGTGKGRFDEHRGEEERLPNECATTLVAKYLGQENDIVLKRIADEVLRCDTKPGVKSTELAELVKMAHRRLEKNEVVLRWCMTVLHALHKRLFGNFDKVSGERTLEQLFEERASSYKDERARNYLAGLVQESTKRAAEEQRITELAFLTECLYRTDKVGDAVDFVRFALDHLYADQLEFQKAVEECKGGEWFDVCALCNKKGNRTHARTLRGLIIETDSSLVQRAARTKEAGGASVVIIRKKTEGNVSVFVDTSQGINLVAFTRMVRWLDLPKVGKTVSWEDLGNAGALPQVPHWYFFRKGQMLLNGSLTHTSVKATEIHPDTLKEVTKMAFHPKSIANWMWMRQIPFPTRKVGLEENAASLQPKAATPQPTKGPPTKPAPTPPQAKAEVVAEKEGLTEAERMGRELEAALNGNQISPA